MFYNYANDLWQLSGGFSQVGERFTPEVGFVPRRGYRRPEFRAFYNLQPKRYPWIRRFSPHANWNAYFGFDGDIQTSQGHWHFFEIQPRRGGRFGSFLDTSQDRPTAPFQVFNANGNRVVIPPGLYDWHQLGFEYQSDPSAPLAGQMRFRDGTFYDGDYNSIELSANGRIGSKFTASTGWTRQIVTLPYGAFTSDLIPMRVGYAFTTLANLQALVQVQRPDDDADRQHPPRDAEPQRHRSVCRLQRPSRHERVRPARSPRPLVRGEVHAAAELLKSPVASRAVTSHPCPP